jgi:hypothetical protein
MATATMSWSGSSWDVEILSYPRPILEHTFEGPVRWDWTIAPVTVRDGKEEAMLGKPLLFLSSYAPLFGLLAIRFQQQWLWISCLVIACLGAGALWLLLRLDARASPGPHMLVAVKDAGPEAASYLAGYLLPFLTVAAPSIRDVLAYLGFLVVAAAVHLRSSVVQVNPLLYLFGYRVLAVEDDHGLAAYMITRRRPIVGTRVFATRFRDEVLVDRFAR